MKKYILHITLIVFLSVSVNQITAQDGDYSRNKDLTVKPKEEKKPKQRDNSWIDDYVFGMGLGIQVGNPVYIEVAPQLGYFLNDKTMIGGSLTYIYYKVNDPIVGNYEGSLYGGSLFASYEPIENIVGWAEYEIQNLKYINQYNQTSREWIHTPLVGVGYKQPFGDRGFAQILLLYNLNYTSNSPYASPFIPRVTIFF